MAIFMENNPFSLALYYGYKNGDFFEVINIDIDKNINNDLKARENETWLVVKIINKDGKRV
ncbi:hypothetical protein [Arcobacter vandammei]|uniref:hypothetical protein n=1 Tax=Arcobacter vandammei TaxID=2782243 RepID=UPI0018E04060|nr:hypothetical protein [Arcobacter vandammei]